MPGRVRGDIRSLDARGGLGDGGSVASCCDSNFATTTLLFRLHSFCAACSVGDQVHKIFVPGRHFDVIDLGFDAAGYVTAMLLVLLAAALVRYATRPIGAHARR